jgi:hypothetical protein
MWFLLALAMFTLAVAIHSVWARVQSSLSLVLRFLGTGAAIGIVHLVLSLVIFGFTEKTISAALVYAVLCELYVFLFTLAANGVSIALMDRLVDGSADPGTLEAKYSEMSMVERRVGQLQTSGFLAEHNGRLQLLPKGRSLVRAFVLLRAFFCHARFPNAFNAEVRPQKHRGAAASGTD